MSTNNDSVQRDIIAKLKEQKMSALFAASMDLPGTESLEEWVDATLEDNKDVKGVEENKKAKDAQNAIYAFNKGIRELLPDQEPHRTIGRDTDEPLFPPFTASLAVIESCSESKKSREAGEAYVKALTSYEKTASYLYKEAIIDLVIFKREGKLKFFLGQHPLVAKFLDGNIDKLQDAAKLFAEFSVRRREHRKMYRPDNKTLRTESNKKADDLRKRKGLGANTSRGKIRSALTSGFAVKRIANVNRYNDVIEGIFSGNNGEKRAREWLRKQALLSLDNAIEVLKSKFVKYLTRADLDIISDSKQQMQVRDLIQRVTRDPNKCIDVLKNRELAKKISDTEWDKIFKYHYERNEDFIYRILDIGLDYPQVIEMTEKLPFLFAAVMKATEYMDPKPKQKPASPVLFAYPNADVRPSIQTRTITAADVSEQNRKPPLSHLS